MHDYRVIAMDEDVAAGVRTDRVAPDYGHPAHAEVAADPAPCRVCLDRFEPGAERRGRFIPAPPPPTADPPPLPPPSPPRAPPPPPGPVFIHEDGGRPYEAAAGFPPAPREGRLTFNAYGP